MEPEEISTRIRLMHNNENELCLRCCSGPNTLSELQDLLEDAEINTETFVRELDIWLPPENAGRPHFEFDRNRLRFISFQCVNLKTIEEFIFYIVKKKTGCYYEI